MTNKTQASGGGGAYPDSPRDQEYNYNQTGEQFVWETHHVHLARVPGYGFGIAISGGIDNPHFPNGDPAIAVCDVLNAGPAAGRIEVNDRIMSVDNHSLENVYHATAISILNNSPDNVSLVLRRKVYLDIDDAEPAPMKIVMKKKSKRDEYGLVLGCRLYVKKIVGNSLAAQEGGLKEGDIILKLNNITSDNLSLNESQRMIERSRDKLSLIVIKDPQNPQKSYTDLLPKIDNTHQSQSQHFDLAEDVLTPERQISDEAAPARPPLPGQFDQNPRDNGPPPYYNTDAGYGPRLQPVGAVGRDLDASQLDEKDIGISRRTNWNPEPRRISFKKSKGGVGIRLAGGNHAGIYIAAVQPDTVAHEQGLQEGDLLLRINNTEMKGKTREDAVLLLLSLESQVELLIQYCKDDYDRFINSNEFGDSFYVRAHFSNSEPDSGQMAFSAGDVFHVKDTLHGGVVGSWRAALVDRNLQQKQEGVIPNRSGAEQILLTQQQKLAASREDSLLRKSFFKRRTARRTKSLNKEGWEDAMFTHNSKFPAYENVIRKTPNFPRPVVLYGSVADIARKMLLRDDSQIYLTPIRNAEGQKEGGVIKLAAIRQVVELGKHCVLDVNPNAVDRLNYAGYYPLVIYLRADSKQTVKEIRSQLAKDSNHSSAKLFDESVRVEKMYAHLFSATITLTSNGTWYQRLKQLIHESRDQAIWICERKAESDDFLVQSQGQSRLSYVSSPVSESGAEGSQSELYERSMMRWSSDPNMGAHHAPPSYRRPPQYANPDFRRELKFAVESHSPPQRHHSNPEDSYSHGPGFDAGYLGDEDFQSPYAKPVPRHRRYQLRPDEEYDRDEHDDWRAPPVPEKTVSLYGLHEQPYQHTYNLQQPYDSETSLRSNQSFSRHQRPQSEYVESPNGGFHASTLPPRRHYSETSPNGPTNGWDNEVLKLTRSTANPYTKPAPIDRIKMQDIRNRGSDRRPGVPPKPMRSKSQNDSVRYYDYDGDSRC